MTARGLVVAIRQVDEDLEVDTCAPKRRTSGNNSKPLFSICSPSLCLPSSVVAGMATTLQASQIEVLNHIFLGLVNKNPDVRLQSAQELRNYVRSAKRARSACTHRLQGRKYGRGDVLGRCSEALGRESDETALRSHPQHVHRRPVGGSASYRCVDASPSHTAP